MSAMDQNEDRPDELSPSSDSNAEQSESFNLKEQEEIDSRSVYVGNVDFQSSPEQLENLFNTVGPVERITIIFDKFTGLPKGYAYVEFLSIEGMQRALNELHGKPFRGREIRVTPKRTNIPGFRKYKPIQAEFSRGRSRGRGSRGSTRARGHRGRGRGNLTTDRSKGPVETSTKATE